MSAAFVTALLKRRRPFIREASTHGDQPDKAAEEARTKALDPLASPDAAKARGAMEDAAFIRDRLRNVLPRLQARYREVVAAEDLARWVPEYERTKATRDQLAAKLCELYVPFVAEMVPLLSAIEKVDAEIRRVNNAKPEAAHGDGRWLREVELEARDMADFGHCLWIMSDLRLPAWERAERPAWPPHRPMTLAMIPPITAGDPRLYSARWEEVFEERARATRECAERSGGRAGRVGRMTGVSQKAADFRAARVGSPGPLDDVSEHAPPGVGARGCLHRPEAHRSPTR